MFLLAVLQWLTHMHVTIDGEKLIKWWTSPLASSMAADEEPKKRRTDVSERLVGSMTSTGAELQPSTGRGGGRERGSSSFPEVTNSSVKSDLKILILDLLFSATHITI